MFELLKRPLKRPIKTTPARESIAAEEGKGSKVAEGMPGMPTT